MKLIVDNILVKKTDKYNDFVNFLFWLLLLSKNILKFVICILYSYFDWKNLTLLFFLLFLPFLKFIFIGIKNLKNFKSALKRTNLTFFMSLIGNFYK